MEERLLSNDAERDPISGKLRKGTLLAVLYWLAYKESSMTITGAFVHCFHFFGLDSAMLLDACVTLYHRIAQENREPLITFVCDMFYNRCSAEWSQEPLLTRLSAMVGPRAEELCAFNNRMAKSSPQPPFSVPTEEPPRPHEVFDDAFKKKRCLEWLTWKTEDIAATLTVMGHTSFVQMRVGELLGPPRPYLEPQIALFRQLSDLVAFTVVSSMYPVEAIERCIKLAEQFAALHNYNLLGAVISGLNSMAAQSAKRAWEELPRKHRDRFEAFEKMLSPVRNFAEYRKALQDRPRDQPCYPYLAVIMKDAVYLNDGTPSHVGEEAHKLLNFEKIVTIGTALDNWRTFQRLSYVALRPPDNVAQWVQLWPQLVPDMTSLSSDLLDSLESGDLSERGAVERKESFFKKVLGKLKSESSLIQQAGGAFPEPGRVVVLGRESGASSSKPGSRPASAISSTVSSLVSSQNNSSNSSPINTSRVDPSSTTAASSAAAQRQAKDDEGDDIAVIGPDQKEADDLLRARELADFLTVHGLSKYLQYFEARNVPLIRLVHLTEADLLSLGITKAPHRAKILEGIKFVRGMVTPRTSGSNLDIGTPPSPSIPHLPPPSSSNNNKTTTTTTTTTTSGGGGGGTGRRLKPRRPSQPVDGGDNSAPAPFDDFAPAPTTTTTTTTSPQKRRGSKARPLQSSSEAPFGSNDAELSELRGSRGRAPKPVMRSQPGVATTDAPESDGKTQQRRKSMARKSISRQSKGRRGSQQVDEPAPRSTEDVEDGSCGDSAAPSSPLCSKCNAPLLSITNAAGGLFCGDCATPRFCYRCHNPVVSDRFNAMGQLWHHDCFTCEICNRVVDGPFVDAQGFPVHFMCAHNAAEKREQLAEIEAERPAPPAASTIASAPAPAPVAAAVVASLALEDEDQEEEETSEVEAKAAKQAQGVTINCTYNGSSSAAFFALPLSFDNVQKSFCNVFGCSDLMFTMLDFEGDLIALKKQTDLDYAVESTITSGKSSLTLSAELKSK